MAELSNYASKKWEKSQRMKRITIIITESCNMTIGKIADHEDSLSLPIISIE